MCAAAAEFKMKNLKLRRASCVTVGICWNTGYWTQTQVATIRPEFALPRLGDNEACDSCPHVRSRAMSRKAAYNLAGPVSKQEFLLHPSVQHSPYKKSTEGA